MWEYNRVCIEIVIISDIIKKLNELGADGWEIIYYNEKKPEKFGESFNVTIVSKRKK